MARFTLRFLLVVCAMAFHSATVRAEPTASAGPALQTRVVAETLSPLLTKRNLNEFVRDNMQSIQSCAGKDLRSRAGQIAVRMTVTPAGHVRNARVEQDTIHDAAVSRCIVRQVAGWVTPFQPESNVSVSFPLAFGPSEPSQQLVVSR